MSLFWQEMRKIWRPGILAALVVLGSLFYAAGPKRWVDQIARTLAFDRVPRLIEQYGPVLNAEARREIEPEYAALKEAFAQKAGQFPEAAELGVTDYQSYLSKRQELPPGIASALWELYLPIFDTFGGVVQLYDGFMNGSIDARTDPHRLARYTPEEQTQLLRLEEAVRTEGLSLMNQTVLSDTLEWGRWLTVWTVFSVLMLLSPALVRDQIYRTRAMQWTSRRGRRVIRSQIAAALASSLLAAGGSMGVYFALLAAQGPLVFRDCPIYTANGGIPLPWFNWTYGQLLLALGGMVLGFALGTGALAAVLSRLSGNYVSMLLKAAPLFAAVGLLMAGWAMTNPFYTWKSLAPHSPRGVEFAAVLLLAAVGLGLCAWLCARERSREM